MLCRRNGRGRPGTIVPLAVVCMTALFGFVALAIDLGLLAVARNQAQNAADLAALAGTRKLNGDQAASNDSANAQTAAQNAAIENSILGQTVQLSQVSLSVGSYAYDSSKTQFVIDASNKPSGGNYTLVQATVKTGSRNYFFAPVLGMNAYNTTATATAAHRPRDTVVVLDFSTSMRFDSLLGTPHNGPRTRSMNPDPNYPKFGHYYGNDSMMLYTGSPVIFASTGEIQGPCNLTYDTNDGPALVKDFYQDTTAFGSSNSAFNNYPTTPTPASAGYVTIPGGDNYLGKSRSAAPPYATNVYDIVPTAPKIGILPADPNWEGPLQTGYGASFNGYTFGPSYWGKTFFIWPPDPRWSATQHQCKDWRYRFFRDSSGNLFKPASNFVNNTYLWDAQGNWLAPNGTNYRIDYQEILYWLANNGPSPFPAQLRSGGVLYYDHPATPILPRSIRAGGRTRPPTTTSISGKTTSIMFSECIRPVHPPSTRL
jgi:Flp pilus assembly protein TadG